MGLVVNKSSISEKVGAWAASNRGRKAVAKRLQEYVQNDVRTTQAGSPVFTLQLMRECADYLVSRVKARASDASDGNFSMVPSVMRQVNSLRRGRVTKLQDGGFSCELNFQGDLSRPSLEPNNFPEGLSNIIALFNNGMNYSYFDVWGEWHGRTIHAIANRPGMRFMQAAVEDFNAQYGDKYDIKVQLLEIYE